MKKVIKSLILTLLAYLIQVTVMPLIPMFSISANFIIIIQSIIIVTYGRQHGIATALILGVLMESMLPSLDYFYLLAYPVIAVLGMVAFADKTDRRLEMERNLEKKHVGNRDPLLRILMCTMFMTLLFELINIVYSLLKGVVFDSNHLLRIIISIFYNTILCLIVMIPIRRFLGFKFVLPSQIKANSTEKFQDIDPNLGYMPIRPIDSKDNVSSSYIPKENLGVENKSPDYIPAFEYKREESSYVNENDVQNADSLPESNEQSGD